LALRALEELAAYWGELRRLGWRGLALVHAESPGGAAASALGALGVDARECIGVADKASRGSLEGLCGLLKAPPRYQELLGSEALVAVIAVGGLLRPNLIAALAETVVEGGILLVGAGPRGRWDPSPPGGRGLYRRYLLNSIMGSRSHIIVDLLSDTVVSRALPREPAPPRPPKPRARPRGVPSALAGLAATPDQLEALAVAARHLTGRGRSLLLIGDRGRGKSYALGLILAMLIHSRQAGRVHVVAPSPHGVYSLFKGLLQGLEALGHGGYFKVKREGGAVTRVWGPWFSVHYQTPEEGEPAPLLVVDEAGAVGVARVRRLSWRSGRLLAASTIHGYEGSGKALLHILEGELPRPLARVELGEPIRYRRGDPLEEWVISTFHLNAEPPEIPAAEAVESECVEVDVERLASDRVYAGMLIGILVQAHYRFEPDYILSILESPNHEILALETRDGKPVAAADVALEHWGLEEAARLGLKLLSAHTTRAQGLRGVRVVRIAVTPSLQRRGLGSRLLGCIEERAGKAGLDVVTAVFSRHDVIGFWVNAGYRVVYISPRYNRATGEKNIAVAKPLTGPGSAAVAEASSNFRVRLLLSLQSIYRDVSAERIPLILEATQPSTTKPLSPTEDMRRRLALFLEGAIDLEQAFDAVWASTVNCLASRSPSDLQLTREEAVALTARILQGKPLNDVAYILSTSAEEAHKLSSSAARILLKRCGEA